MSLRESAREDRGGYDWLCDGASDDFERKTLASITAGEDNAIGPVRQARHCGGATRWRERRRGQGRYGKQVIARPSDRHCGRARSNVGHRHDGARRSARNRQMRWQCAAVCTGGQGRQADGDDHYGNKSKAHAVLDGSRSRLVPTATAEPRNGQHEERRPGVRSRGVANAHSPGASGGVKRVSTNRRRIGAGHCPCQRP